MNTDFQSSNHDQRTGERRAIAQVQAPMPDGWHLDKKVPLGLIFALLVQTVGVVWFFAGLRSDIELLKQDNLGLHARDVQAFEAINAAVKSFMEQYRLLDAKLDRLIERDHSK